MQSFLCRGSNFEAWLPGTRKEHSRAIILYARFLKPILARLSQCRWFANQVARFLRLDAEDMLYRERILDLVLLPRCSSSVNFVVTGALRWMCSRKPSSCKHAGASRTIRRIGPYVPARVVGKDFLKHIAVMHGRIRNSVARSACIDIDRHMIL